MLELLPFEIIVTIAEIDDEVWYLMSLLLRDFGVYSITQHIKQRAMKRFNRQHLNDGYCSYFLKNDKKHGKETKSWLAGDKYNLLITRFKNGIHHGTDQFFIDGVLRTEWVYDNEYYIKEVEYHDDGKTPKRIHSFKPLFLKRFDESGNKIY